MEVACEGQNNAQSAGLFIPDRKTLNCITEHARALKGYHKWRGKGGLSILSHVVMGVVVSMMEMFGRDFSVLVNEDWRWRELLLSALGR